MPHSIRLIQWTTNYGFWLENLGIFLLKLLVIPSHSCYNNIIITIKEGKCYCVERERSRAKKRLGTFICCGRWWEGHHRRKEDDEGTTRFGLDRSKQMLLPIICFPVSFLASSFFIDKTSPEIYFLQSPSTFIVFLGIFLKNIFTIFTSLGNPQLVPNASTTSQLDHWTKCFLNWTPSILVLIFLIILYSKTTPFQDNLTFSFTISWWL